MAGPLVLLDVGAGMQVNPVDLVQHAALGAAYARLAAGDRRSPGSDCSRSAPSRARATGYAGPPTPRCGCTRWPTRVYVGPVEGHDVVTGARADVVVTDGFTGNVLLKGVEAALAAAPGVVPAHGGAPGGGAARRGRHRRGLPRGGQRRGSRLGYRARGRPGPPRPSSQVVRPTRPAPARAWPRCRHDRQRRRRTLSTAPARRRHGARRAGATGARSASDGAARPSTPVEEALGITLSAWLLRQALTHRSFAYENGGLPTNERLEFLGDSVLGLVVTTALYDDHPDLPEGRLAKLRASVVNSRALADVARGLGPSGLGPYLLLGKGEETTGGRDKESILADTLEAVLGAVYLQHGLPEARPRSCTGSSTR